MLRALGRRLLKRRARCFRTVGSLLEGKAGLEIGGPSALFSRGGRLPVYLLVSTLDNCNYSSNTVWEGAIDQGKTFRFDKKHDPGNQYIADAVDLSVIGSGTYDFVLSAHTLEHIANPLRAMSQWMRVLKPDGVLVLAVPDKDATFDHRRPVTSLEHLIEDCDRGTTEEDLTHLPEILAFHDLQRDPEAGDFRAFKERSENNFENRCLHQHVFDTRLAVDVMNQMGLEIVALETMRPHHILAVAKKAAASIVKNN